jgi:hypothetical protein
MSEIAQTTTATESAPPTSTAEIASQVIEAAERTPSEDSGETAAGVTATSEAPGVVEPVRTTQEPPKDLSEEEKLLVEFGFKQAFKPDGREHYIPRSKVLQMIGSGLKRGLEKWTGEKTTLEQRATELQGNLNEMYQDIMGEPKELIAKLAEVNPRYRAFLEPHQAATPQAQTPAQDAEMPAPDYPLPDGSRTYSLEGIQKQLIPWLTQAITKQLESKMDAKLKPWEERDKELKAERERNAIVQRTQSHMQEAQAWPDFGQLPADGTLTAFQQAVLDRLKQDTAAAKAAGRRPSMTLREAYLEVRTERLSTDHNTVREAVLKELNDAPKSPTLARQSVDSPKSSRPMSTAEIARSVITQLEAKR